MFRNIQCLSEDVALNKLHFKWLEPSLSPQAAWMLRAIRVFLMDLKLGCVWKVRSDE